MKFDKAYCTELKKEISPYFARELYFNQESNYYGVRLHYGCPNSDCDTILIPYNVYRNERLKQKIHFHTKIRNLHSSSCDYTIESQSNKLSYEEAKRQNRIKNSILPTELVLNKQILEKKSKLKNDVPNESTNHKQKSSVASKSKKFSKNTSSTKTPFFDHIVDCYENIDEKVLKEEFLTINAKKKRFYYFFKKCQYFYDEKGLIYWGEVSELKQYGKNYSIKFKNKAKVGDKYLSINIYITEGLINAYNKKKQFTEILNLLSEHEGIIRCYFVDAYPDKELVEKNGLKFDTLKVEIKNLGHLVLRFDENVNSL